MCRKQNVKNRSKQPIIRGEPERAPNTRETGSGFICVCILYICMFVGSTCNRVAAETRQNAHAHAHHTGPVHVFGVYLHHTLLNSSRGQCEFIIEGEVSYSSDNVRLPRNVVSRWHASCLRIFIKCCKQNCTVIFRGVRDRSRSRSRDRKRKGRRSSSYSRTSLRDRNRNRDRGTKVHSR